MNIDWQEMSNRLKKDMGWKWYWYSLTGWIYDHTGLIQDVWWWMSDGKPYWPDADASSCPRKLCRFCGNKPFGK